MQRMVLLLSVVSLSCGASHGAVGPETAKPDAEVAAGEDRGPDEEEAAPSGRTVGTDGALDVPEEDGEILECPDVFSDELRGKWHRVTGEDYFIDGSGRPERARTMVPPFLEDGRQGDCQRDVGHWGAASDPGNVYHGGHMIGCQLGGWGARANLVPQVGGFNTGNWLQLENALHDCGDDLAPGRLLVVVSVTYTDATSLVPATMSMNIADTADTSNAIGLTFDNAAKGGSGGTDERKRGVEWLRAIGCARDEGGSHTPPLCSGS